MRILKSAINFILFHLQFLLVEFGVFFFISLIFIGNIRIGIALGLTELGIRTLLGNYIAYYFLFRMKLNDSATYALSLVVAFIFWMISVMIGDEIGKLALRLLRMPTIAFSVFGGIAMANYVMLRMRQKRILWYQRYGL